MLFNIKKSEKNTRHREIIGLFIWLFEGMTEIKSAYCHHLLVFEEHFTDLVHIAGSHRNYQISRRSILLEIFNDSFKVGKIYGILTVFPYLFRKNP